MIAGKPNVRYAPDFFLSNIQQSAAKDSPVKRCNLPLQKLLRRIRINAIQRRQHKEGIFSHLAGSARYNKSVYRGCSSPSEELGGSALKPTTHINCRRSLQATMLPQYRRAA